MTKKEITLTVCNVDVSFLPDPEMYSDYLGAIARGCINDAAHNFVMTSATEDSKDALRKFDRDNPGAMIQIASIVSVEFAPKMQITVKK